MEQISLTSVVHTFFHEGGIEAGKQIMSPFLLPADSIAVVLASDRHRLATGESVEGSVRELLSVIGLRGRPMTMPARPWSWHICQREERDIVTCLGMGHCAWQIAEQIGMKRRR